MSLKVLHANIPWSIFNLHLVLCVNVMTFLSNYLSIDISKNDITKHKNWHSLIFFYVYVPRMHQGDTILAICYLINRVSIIVLHVSSPSYFIWVNLSFFFSLHLESLDVHALAPRLGKFNRQSIHFIFFRYLKTQILFF